MPEHIPAVKEVGASSAPLMSAAYFIGARCRPYNDDYMQCKTESYGRGELDCLKEGRKVTRCAASVLVYPWRASIKRMKLCGCWRPSAYKRLRTDGNHTSGSTTSTKTVLRNFALTGSAWRTTTISYGNADGRRGY